MGISRPARTTDQDTTTMLAAVARRFGGPEVVVLERVPRPEPRADEVLVRVRATTVSVGDHRIRARDLPRGLGVLGGLIVGVRRPRFPVLGSDAAGVVEAVGSGVRRFRPGDEVLVQRGMRHLGCHAELLVEPEAGGITAKPAGLSFAQAAALPFGGHTALSFLDRVTLGPGTTVLVNGAAGAVGSLAVQLAARARATVTGVCSAANAELVLSLGAHRAIDYAVEDFAAGPDRYDVIVECVGNAPFERVRGVLAPGGSLLMVVSDLPSMLTARRDGRRIGGLVTAFGAKLTEGEGLRRLAQLAAAGELTAVVDSVYPIERIVEAHRRVDTGHKRGSVVVTFD